MNYIPEKTLETMLNDIVFYIVKMGFDQSEVNVSGFPQDSVHMYELRDILKLDQKELESTVFTFDKNLAHKSVKNDLKEFINQQSVNNGRNFKVFKIKRINLKPQGEDQTTHPEVLIKLMDDS